MAHHDRQTDPRSIRGRNNIRRHQVRKLRAEPGIELVPSTNRSKESGERVALEFGIARVREDWQGA